jgi:phage FluMu protein Com
MPIRFRCAYCNQLMGISRRKAGTVVRCPKCAGEIIVPTVDEAPDQDEATQKPAANGGVFNDPNFNPFADAPPGGAGSPAATGLSESGPAPVELPPAAPPAPEPASPPRRLGVFVPLGLLIVAVGVVMLLLILVFVIGLILGRHMALAPDAIGETVSISWGVSEPEA